MTGHLVLHGEHIPIDCIGMRDRTWGRRPENRPRRAAYVTAALEPGDGFLAVTDIRDGHDTIAYGFLRRDGHTSTLAGGERWVERSADHGWITRIEIEGTDADGRLLHAVGHPVSRMMIDRHTFVDVNSLLRWEVDGDEAWGEDQDMWPVHDWSAHRRDQRQEQRP